MNKVGVPLNVAFGLVSFPRINDKKRKDSKNNGSENQGNIKTSQNVHWESEETKVKTYMNMERIMWSVS